MTVVHQCSTCSHTFTRKADLNRHMNIHRAIRPYVCTRDGCFQRFGQRNALKIHDNVHTGKKPYLCRVAGCTQTFGDPSSLTRHKKEKHSSKHKFRCPTCATEIKRKSAFKKHYKEKHGITMNEADLQRCCVYASPLSSPSSSPCNSHLSTPIIRVTSVEPFSSPESRYMSCSPSPSLVELRLPSPSLALLTLPATVYIPSPSLAPVALSPPRLVHTPELEAAVDPASSLLTVDGICVQDTQSVPGAGSNMSYDMSMTGYTSLDEHASDVYDVSSMNYDALHPQELPEVYDTLYHDDTFLQYPTVLDDPSDPVAYNTDLNLSIGTLGLHTPSYMDSFAQYPTTDGEWPGFASEQDGFRALSPLPFFAVPDSPYESGESQFSTPAPATPQMFSAPPSPAPEVAMKGCEGNFCGVSRVSSPFLMV